MVPILGWMADTESENAALRARVRALEEDAAKRKTLGRPPKKPSSPDGKLIANVCRHLRLRRRELAVRLGVVESLLSRVNSPTAPKPLAERHRAALRAMLIAGGKPGEQPLPG